jgi:hypothetical protein
MSANAGIFYCAPLWLPSVFLKACKLNVGQVAMGHVIGSWEQLTIHVQQVL